MRGAAPIALAMAVALQAGCGVAARAGQGAAHGAVGAFAAKVPPPGRIEEMAEVVKRRAVQGGLGALGQPQQLAELQRIAGTAAAGAVSGALGAASGAPLASRRGGELGVGLSPSPPPVEAITGQAARGMAEALTAALGPEGGGPLGSSLSAATERTAAAMTRGVAAEIRASLGIWPLALAFGAGGLLVLALAWAWAIFAARRRPPAAPLHPPP